MTDVLPCCKDLTTQYLCEQEELRNQYDNCEIYHSEYSSLKARSRIKLVSKIKKIFVSSSWDDQMEIYAWATETMRYHLNSVLTEEQRSIAMLMA